MRTVNPTLSQKCATAEAASKPTAKTDGNWNTTATVQLLTCADERFSYTTLSGNTATVTTCTQMNSYVFNPEHFAQFAYPVTWPAGRQWPPQSIEHLCGAPGAEAGPCVGGPGYSHLCEDSSCNHKLGDWERATKDWTKHFELRETPDRGIGVFTKCAFEKGDVIGWYTGELVVRGGRRSAYNLAMTLGRTPRSKAEHTLNVRPNLCKCVNGDNLEEEVTIDARDFGNWTRFINHSCDAYTDFAAYRVGPIRITAVEARKDIPTNVELTISYGSDYFQGRTCLCGAANCLETKKWVKKAVDLIKGPRGVDEVEPLEKSMANVQI